MIKLIVTGNISAGKSLFVRKLKKLLNRNDILFIDLDELLPFMYEDPSYQQELLATFGTSAQAEIFKLVSEPGNEDKANKLGVITFRFVDDNLLDMAVSNRHIVFELPYFFEMMIQGPRSVANLVRDKFTVVTVTGPSEPELLKARHLANHPDWDDAIIKQVILGCQLTAELLQALADVDLVNNGTEADLEASTQRFILENMPAATGSFRTDLEIDWLDASHNTINANVFRIIDYAYSDPYRAYHNIEHLNYMFRLLDSSGYKHKNHPSLLLAILFHDFIYVPGSANNEDKSAAAMTSLIRTFNPELVSITDPGVLDLAVLMILSTIDHTLTEDLTALWFQEWYDFDVEEMAKVLLDLDLAIFSGDWEQVLEYDDNISQEYYGLFDSDFEFQTKRLAYLQKLKSRPALYQSKCLGGSMWELQGQESLKLLIQLYEAKLAGEGTSP